MYTAKLAGFICQTTYEDINETATRMAGLAFLEPGCCGVTFPLKR